MLKSNLTKKLLASTGAALLSTAVYAADPPPAKEGLWSVHTQTTKNPGNQKSEETYTLCRTNTFDHAVQESVKKIKGCTMTRDALEGDKYFQNLHCVTPTTVVESKATTTFQGTTGIHAETHATYNPAMSGISEMTIVMDQKYVGRCPPGAIPGDKTDPSGKLTRLGAQ
jgi:hypothetical protein